MVPTTPKFLIVARQHFLDGIRSKWFLFSTFVLPLVMMGLMGLAVLLATRGGEPSRVVVLDETDQVYELLKAQLTERNKDGELQIELDKAKITSLAPPDAILPQLRERVLERELDSYLHIPEDFLESAEARFFGLSVSNFDLNARLSRGLTNALREKRLSETDIDPADLAAVMQPAKLSTYRVTEEGETEDRGQTFGLVYALVMLLYMTVIIYGASISRSITEEKVSRIVEVMLASLRPFELLSGKILGVGLVGLCQMSVWCGVAYFTLEFRQSIFDMVGSEITIPFELPDFPLWLIAHFVGWFLLGYFLFAMLYAMVASIAGSETESQQLQFPVVMLLVVPLISMMPIIQHPNSTYSVVMSMVPFFAPIVMFMRTAVLTPPWYQIAASMTICFLTIIFLVWLTAKIYRIGILSYGKRPSLRELLQWIAAS